ncbi:hypothetical protein KXD93_16650 [Mucilaginibacter sp. BJC16-A38]|uniref:hypothetical protein n=1 Tax=Mucilaginibacter phenanthrenivorans TaxID=1234842 RepID=UPI0021572D2C|nr:hypothetical protein [Mucilaginibacter phenanthrenivorans]MCR8559289.1 hypothetical protein [Mucilaginibacter phenanthrenivorans]
MSGHELPIAVWHVRRWIALGHMARALGSEACCDRAGEPCKKSDCLLQCRSEREALQKTREAFMMSDLASTKGMTGSARGAD